MEFSYAQMEQLIQNGHEAYQYAWEHYEELNNRPCVHTLFGPPSYHLGVMAAGHLTPSKDRKIQKSTKRKRFLQYELDENYQVIRIREMRDYSVVECTYHLFQLKGITYARAFWGEEKIPYVTKTYAIKYQDGRPFYFAITQKNYLCIDFYEYPCEDTVRTSCYLYLPGGELTVPGYNILWDVPYGAPGSPVTLDHCSEPYQHINFAKYCV